MITSRRSFLAAISSLPLFFGAKQRVLGWLKPAEPTVLICRPVDYPKFKRLLDEKPGVFPFRQRISFKHSDWKGVMGRQT